MAKLTKKIRISEYEVLNNRFILTFQLAGYDHQLSFEAYVADNSVVYFDVDSDDILVEFGFSNSDIGQMIDELTQWLEKPRKNLDGNSHAYTMRSRFEVAERLEAERRGKAAVERIQVEAPCLDWAMSVTEEVVGEENVIRAAMNADSVHSALSPLEELEIISNAIRAGYGTPPRGVETSALTWIAPERGSIDPPQRSPLGTFFSTPLKDDGAAAKAMRAGMETAIAAMENAGLGEKANRIELNIVEGSPGLDTPAPSEVLASLYRDIKSKTEIRAECGFDPSKLPTEAIGKAVNAIHKHARRFLSPMSLREHDFLRAVIREEIEKVVGGVL